MLSRPYLVASGILTHEGFIGSRKLGSVVIDVNDLDCNGNFGFLVLFVCRRGNTEMRQKQENPPKEKTVPSCIQRKIKYGKDQICGGISAEISCSLSNSDNWRITRFILLILKHLSEILTDFNCKDRDIMPSHFFPIQSLYCLDIAIFCINNKISFKVGVSIN